MGRRTWSTYYRLTFRVLRNHPSLAAGSREGLVQSTLCYGSTLGAPETVPPTLCRTLLSHARARKPALGAGFRHMQHPGTHARKPPLRSLFRPYHTSTLPPHAAPWGRAVRGSGEGSQRALQELDAGRARIARALDEIQWTTMARPVQMGAVSARDSESVLGLQAADIAAAVARDTFEGAEGTTRSRAGAVRCIFDHVLLNDEWL